MKPGEIERWRDEVRRCPLGPEALKAMRRDVGKDGLVLRELEGEQALSQLLAGLPDAEVHPRFTVDVLEALARDEQRDGSRWGWTGWLAWLQWSPRLAGAALALLLVPLALWQQQSMARTRMAASVADITRPVAAAAQALQLPPMDILQDYEAIDRLRRTSALADVELLASFGAESRP